MLTREATYEDYGFSEEEDKKFNEFCRKLEMRDKILLLQCAAEVYPNVCDELYCCIVIGMSYTILGEDGIYNEKKLAEFQQKHSVVTTIILNIPRLPEEGVLNAEKK